MVMLRRLAVKRAALLAGWLIAITVTLPGCGTLGAGAFEAWVTELAGSSHILTETVKIRIVNQSAAMVSLEVNVDGFLETLTCSAQSICETPLGYCPNMIELVSERRFDTRGTFLGGRDFEDADVFTLTQEDFECDETVIYRFTESNTELMVL